MNETSTRITELDKWSVITRICANLEQAMVLTQEFMKRTSHIVIWPVQQEQWLVIARLPILLN